MKIELVSNTPNPELTIAYAAKTCYDSPTKDLESSRKMIRALVKAGHEAMIEHASASFKLSEVSRVLTHELVRHRLFSFAQRSQRYVKENEETYVTPDVLVNINQDDDRLREEARPQVPRPDQLPDDAPDPRCKGYDRERRTGRRLLRQPRGSLQGPPSRL